MSFVARFMMMKERLEDAIDSALLTDVAEEVKDIMVSNLDSIVYSYSATPQAMATRRYDGGLRGKYHMAASLPEKHTLVVENTAGMQGGAASRALSDVVNDGDPAYRQPGARPFVSATEREAVASGRALTALMDGLRKRGVI